MKNIPFQIEYLEVESFNIQDKEIKEDSPIEIITIYEFGVNKNNYLVRASITYEYLQDDIKILEMTLISTFQVDPEAFNDMVRGNKFILEPFFSQYLSTINVGAARGEIHARCEQAKSVIADIILPPINLMEALPETIEIEISE